MESEAGVFRVRNVPCCHHKAKGWYQAEGSDKVEHREPALGG